VTLLDVATGSADLPLAATRWARRAGFQLRVTGVDKHHATLALAREHVKDEVELRPADALELDTYFMPGSFDYVHAGLFLRSGRGHGAAAHERHCPPRDHLE
jgi:ubiquinone/menaquinone biosynthesis C-methylase UbiE